MSRLLWLYVGLLLPASGISAALVVYAWRHRERRGAVALAVTLFGALLWELSALLSVVGRGTRLALFSTQPATVGADLTVVGFFLFALAYTGREDLVTLRTGVALSVVPAVALVLKTANSLHGTYWTSVVRDMSEISGYTIEYGLAFYGYTAYSYALLLLGTVLILDYAVDAASVYRYQTTAIVVAVLVPLASNALLVFEVVEADLAPVAFAVSGVAFWWAIYRAEFLDLAPVGRQVVVDDLYDGVFTIDRDHRLVDVNPTGRELFGFEDEPIVGEHVDDLLAEFPEIRDLYWAKADAVGDTAFDVEFRGRHYHVEVLDLTEGLDAGRTIHVRDVTDQKRREQELERKNERLERFASIVSHDLRNPLNVIQGRVELAERDADVDPHLESIATNADRMGDIIDDVLAMTREDEVRHRERVDVTALATRAWNHVHTEDATLETPASHAVAGDPDRIVQLLENLFRNAVEHGSTGSQNAGRSGDAVEHGSTSPQRTGDAVEHGSTSPAPQARQDAVTHGGPGVTVTVGPLDDGHGFFVADDGPGIPEEDRERVLEDGFTTSDAGTGLGLSIVAEIVDAHGWTLDVAASDAGGARFEVHCGANDTANGTDAVTDPVSDGRERPES